MAAGLKRSGSATLESERPKENRRKPRSEEDDREEGL
jgi:hypothetical protein